MTTTPPTNASARDEFFYDNEDVGLDALAELQCEADAEIKYRKEKVAFTKAKTLKVNLFVKELEALVQTKKLLRKHMNILVAKCTETEEPETSRIQRKIKQMELHWALKHKRCRSIKDTLNYPPTPTNFPHCPTKKRKFTSDIFTGANVKKKLNVDQLIKFGLSEEESKKVVASGK